MTTDTASVDALRTRLARAFEVAALRDPSAELAAFEAAVREHVAKEIDDHAANYAPHVSPDVLLGLRAGARIAREP